jgi:hypothetical protein
VTFGLCTALLGASGCAGRSDALRPPPATDPMRAVQARQMMEEGLSLARAGDLVRAEQYLAESLDRGADPRAVLPTLLRVCVSASRYRAAVTYAARYLERNPGDWPLRFLVSKMGTMERPSIMSRASSREKGCPWKKPRTDSTATPVPGCAGTGPTRAVSGMSITSGRGCAHARRAAKPSPSPRQHERSARRIVGCWTETVIHTPPSP